MKHLLDFQTKATYCGLTIAAVPKVDSLARSGEGCTCLQCLQGYAAMLESSHSQIRVALGDFLDENPDKAEGLTGGETMAAVVLMLSKIATDPAPMTA